MYQVSQPRINRAVAFLDQSFKDLSSSAALQKAQSGFSANPDRI